MASMHSGTKVGNAKLRSFNVTGNFMAVFKLQTLTLFIPPRKDGNARFTTNTEQQLLHTTEFWRKFATRNKKA